MLHRQKHHVKLMTIVGQMAGVERGVKSTMMTEPAKGGNLYVITIANLYLRSCCFPQWKQHTILGEFAGTSQTLGRHVPSLLATAVSW